MVLQGLVAASLLHVTLGFLQCSWPPTIEICWCFAELVCITTAEGIGRLNAWAASEVKHVPRAQSGYSCACSQKSFECHMLGLPALNLRATSRVMAGLHRYLFCMHRCLLFMFWR